MKCTIPEISWHNKEPIYSVDIYPENQGFYRLASGGSDCHVLIWQMTIADNGAVNQDLISDLTKHQRAVNCVRWSPSGKFLATADDDANIIIWQLKTDNIPMLEGNSDNKEIWIVYKVMRGHKDDVYDLCWSMDEMKLLSGSVDNTAILWHVQSGKLDRILGDHKGFVQGVAWDPKNQLVATISTDRVCRIFDITGKHVKARIQKGKLSSVPDSHMWKDKEVKYFHDDTFKSFFRRLQFTPDGSLLIVPSGHIEADDCPSINATLIFTLDNFTCPRLILPIPRQSSTVVRCCPILFNLHEDGPDPIVQLPYRMIFSVGTDHDVVLYDTQQTSPFARFQDIHYTRLTDITWSSDGLLLIASSTDGFCSLITFEPNELGTVWVPKEKEQVDSSVQNDEDLRDENVDISNKNVEEVKVEVKKRPSFLLQWASTGAKKRKIEETTKVEKEIETVVTPKSCENVMKTSSEASKPTTRRIAPILLESRASSSSNCREKSTGDSDGEVLSNEERTELCKASESIQEFFCRKAVTVQSSDNNMVAKPIQIRKKPRDLTVKSETTAITTIVTEENKVPDCTTSEKSLGLSKKPKPVKETTTVKTAPKKSKNALLSFLKKPTEPIIVLEEEVAARDAWSCDSNDVKPSTTEVAETFSQENDESEDFCLRLEESQEGDVKIDEALDTKEVTKEVEKPMPRTPRRVRLITLSSPSCKSQNN